MAGLCHPIFKGLALHPALALAVWDGVLVLVHDPRTGAIRHADPLKSSSGSSLPFFIGIVSGGLLGRIRWLERTLNRLIVALAGDAQGRAGSAVHRLVRLRRDLEDRDGRRLAFFPIMTNTILGIKSVDSGHRDVMLALERRAAGRPSAMSNCRVPCPTF